jgi:outer membrane protein TolC
LSVLLLGVSGCGANHYRKSADKEAAKVIAQKAPAVPNMDPHFTLEQTNRTVLAGLPAVTRLEDFLGTEKEAEANAAMLSLEKALAVAVERSRDYQNQKEILYLEALSLTLARHRFTPIFSGDARSTVQNQPQDVAKAIDQLAGTQTSLLQQDTVVVQQYNTSGRGSVGASVLLRTGARLASSLSLDFFRFLNGDPRFVVRSSIAGTLTQPLWQGAGAKVTLENLTQAERDLLYGLRDFTLYRKTFSVQIAQAYYGVLEARDAARNEWLGYQNLQLSFNRQRAFAEEGRTRLSELGLLEQSLLSAEDQWINSIRRYKQSLDQFKIQLGLPTDARLVLEDRELKELKINHPDLGAEDAVKVALATRLELQTARERAQDAARKVKVAANLLKPRLDLVVSGNVDSKPGSNNPLDLDFDRARGAVGLNLDPGLDRKGARNEYRRALIEKERAARQAQLREDEIKLQVYEDWRNLDQAKRNFEISESGVKLAERRVEEQQLLMELGRGTMRDLVDAQTSLIRSLNARTSALVRHTTARLQFWRDMGILYIKDDGRWEELANAKP